MAAPITVIIRQSEFDRSLRKYASLTKRTPAEICNRKAYFINRRAIWHTHKADPERIKKELGAAEATNLVRTKSGKRFSRTKKNRTYVFPPGGRWYRIFVARLRKAGKEIPGAKKLETMMLRAFKARLKAVAFITSGFIPARNAFEGWCKAHGVSIGGKGIPRSEGPRTARQIGVPKGGGTPASTVWRASSRFFNSATGKHGNAALNKYAGAGLAQSFAEETADTIAEIEKRLKQHARTCGIRTR